LSEYAAGLLLRERRPQFSLYLILQDRLLMFRIQELVWIIVLLLPFPRLLAQSSDDRVAPIVMALRQQEFEKALGLLHAALNASPSDAQLWTMQGVAYRGEGKNKEALESFRHALKLFPDNIPSLQGIAEIEFEASNPAAIPVIEHLLRLQPNDLTSHGMLAILEYQKRDCNAAVPHFEKAAALFKSRLPALNAYGTCLVKLKRLEKASEVFAQALDLNPQDRRQRQVLASVQLMAKDSDKAIATLNPLLNAGADVPTLELASAAYEDAHQTEKAVSTLREAILTDPQNVNLYVDFAVLSAAHQSFQFGIDVVNDGIHLLPKAAPLYFARGVLFVQLAEYEKAQADFDTAYELDPSQSLSVAAQGLSAVQRNDLESALSGVESKLARNPDDPILLYMQADILAQQGADPNSPEFAKAMRSARKAVEIRPTLGPARSVLAKLYLQSGQYQEAAVECRKAIQIDPKDQTAVYHLIQALRKTDDKKEISDLLKRLAALRKEATAEEREQYRYKLVEGDSQPK
jgi:tetratricopeptide (TPR) repeat protein